MSLAANQDPVPWSEGTLALQLSDDGLLPCFYGFASRREVEELLKEKPLGSFLLRLSESQAGIVLSYSGTDRCRHFIIEHRPENRYRILGEEQLHNSIPELLDFHKKVPILPFVEYLTTACEKIPDKLYEDIDSIRRRKLAACEAGGGAAAGVTPNVPEDRAGSTSLPGATAFDPKAARDPHHWAVEEAVKATLDDAANQEIPDKLYEDIDRVRRRRPGACEAGGGAAASVAPNVPEDRAGSTLLPGATAFDPKAARDPHHWAVEGAAKATLDDVAYQEVPDKHYEDIDRVRRRKLGACEAGGGAAAGVVPAGSTSLAGATAFDPKAAHDPQHWAVEGAAKAKLDGIAYQEVPDKHYEDIDRVRRRKLGACEAGGGAAAGIVPAGSTSLPGATAFDPKAAHDPQHWAVEGAAKATLDDVAYQEIPDKLYEDIDRVRRRRPGACEAGGGAAASVAPNVPDHRAGSTSLPGATAFDPKAAHDPHLDDVAYQEIPGKLYEDIDRIRRRRPGACKAGGGAAAGVAPNVLEDGAGSTLLPGATAFDPKVTQDPQHWTTKVTLQDATYQEIPEARTSGGDASRKGRSSCPAEAGVGPAQPSQEAVTYARVNKAKRHIYTEPGPRPSTALEATHTYADPRDGADERLTLACRRELHHVYSELDLQQARRGNLYCPAPTKGAPATPDLPPRPLPTAPPGWHSPQPPLPPTPPTYAQPARRSLGLHPPDSARGPAGGCLELDDPAYGLCPRPVPGWPEPAARTPPASRPGRTPPAPEPHQAENLYERVPEEYLRPPPFAPSRATSKRDL